MPQRPGKPRSVGLTSLYDYGLPTARLEAWLEVVADVVDVAKLADHTGLIQRYPHAWVARRIELYRRHGIRVYPGGVPYEIAVLQGRVEAYFDAVAAVGFDGVEISEDLIGVQERTTKETHIAWALARGLSVKTELGAKFPGAAPTFTVEQLAAMAHQDLDCGVTMVLLEHAELARFMPAGPDTVRALRDAVGPERIMFEAGGPSGWPAMPVWLIGALGPTVNLENLPGDDHTRYLIVEAYRHGMHRDIGYPFLRPPGTNGKGDDHDAR